MAACMKICGKFKNKLPPYFQPRSTSDGCESAPYRKNFLSISGMLRIQISGRFQLFAALRVISQRDEGKVEDLELRSHRLRPNSIQPTG